MCGLSWVISKGEFGNQTGQTPRLSLLHVWHWDTTFTTRPISAVVYRVATIEIVDSHGPVSFILLHSHYFTTCFCCYYHFLSHCNYTANLASPLLSPYIQRSDASSIFSQYLVVALNLLCLINYWSHFWSIFESTASKFQPRCWSYF